MTDMINVFGSYVGPEELQSVQSVLDSQWLGMGKRVEAFEQIIASHVGVADCVMVDSGSNALALAISALELPKGGEIIVPSFTWISCVTSIILNGYKPVFCDVDFDSGSADFTSIRSVISDSTVAIMFVHYAGLPHDLSDLRCFGLPIIEDCAHAVDSYIGSTHIASSADVAIFSFDAVKNITCGEGGAIVSTRPELLDRVRMLRYCGVGKSGFAALHDDSSTRNKMWWQYGFYKSSMKCLPSDIHAAIGIAQMSKLAILQEKRLELYQCYMREITSKQLRLRVHAQPTDINNKSSLFTILVSFDESVNRNVVAEFLLKSNIYSTLRYEPLHEMRAFNSYRVASDMSATSRLGASGLNLPIHPRMSESDVKRITAALAEALDVSCY